MYVVCVCVDIYACIFMCVCIGRCVQRTVSSYYRQQLHLSKQGGHHHVIEDPDVGTSMHASMQGDGSGPSTSSSLPSDSGPGKSEISYVITLVLSREFTHSIAAFRVRPLRPCLLLPLLCIVRLVKSCTSVSVSGTDQLIHAIFPIPIAIVFSRTHRRFS